MGVDNTGNMRYQHVPLTTTGSIRLLRLQPGRYLDAIAIRLFEVSLSTFPEYEALSYVWGSSLGNVPVICHGKELLVTENCVLALRRIRHEDRGRVLWIDAICIDQSSEKERSDQVQLMGDIYTNARRTLIWLGEASEWSGYVMDFLDAYARVLWSRWPRPIRNFLLDSKIKDMKKTELRLVDDEMLGSRVIFQSVTHREWFKRLWTIQEYVLSTDAQILCGEKVVNSQKFFSAILAYSRRRRKHHKGPRTDQPLNAAIASYIHIFDPIRLGLQRKQPSQFSAITLLSCARELKATDPKDAIFGLYGILQRHGLDVSRVDYTKSVHSIYTEATRAAITHDKSLIALLSTSGSQEWPYLPSWVPDWNLHEESKPWQAYGEWGDFNASRYAVCSFKFLDQNRSLSVRGVIIDTIQNCAFRSYPGWRGTEKLVFSSNRDLSTLMPIMVDMREASQSWTQTAMAVSSYPTGEVVGDVLHYVMTNDSMRRGGEEYFKTVWGGDDEFDENSAFHHWLQLVSENEVTCLRKEENSDRWELNLYGENVAEREIQKSNQPGDLTMGTEVNYLSNDFMQNFMSDKNVLAYESLVALNNAGERLFTTLAGYIGKGVAGVQSGDMVVLISGLKIPVIARSAGGGSTYRVLGPAYVHGIMDGEKWPDDEKDLIDIVFV